MAKIVKGKQVFEMGTGPAAPDQMRLDSSRQAGVHIIVVNFVRVQDVLHRLLDEPSVVILVIADLDVSNGDDLAVPKEPSWPFPHDTLAIDEFDDDVGTSRTRLDDPGLKLLLGATGGFRGDAAVLFEGARLGKPAGSLSRCWTMLMKIVTCFDIQWALNKIK